MKRLQGSKGSAVAVVTADLHLRLDPPRCRKPEEFIESQERKLQHLVRRAKQLNVPLLIAGDVFHRAKPPSWAKLILWAYKALKKAPRVVIIPGNHDLPSRSMERLDESALGLLTELLGDRLIFGRIPVGEFFHLRLPGLEGTVMTHTFLQGPNEARPWAKETGFAPEDYHGTDERVIICGDNHQSFSFRDRKGRLWINPGAMTRQSVSEARNVPCYYVMFRDERKVFARPEPFPIGKDEEVFLRHSDYLEEDYPKMKEFIEKIKADYQYGLTLEEILLRRLPESEEGVRRQILSALEEAEEKRPSSD